MPHTETLSQDSALWAASTSRFYDKHADEYFEKTVHANLTHLYERFLSRVPHRGRILDVGCGSGRDLKAFKSRGYRPFGIDSSSKLVRLAREYAGVECEVRRIQDIAYDGEFDAVWACASLLHLPKSELGEALKRLRRALVKNGVLFASVQIGQGEQVLRMAGSTPTTTNKNSCALFKARVSLSRTRGQPRIRCPIVLRSAG